MSKYYNEQIDKHIPWDGNEKTENKRVRGIRVEEFLKNTLEKKIGELYYDASNNRYLAFADAENRDVYLNDTTKTELLLATFDAPFNYSAEINLITPTYNAVFLGSTGNYIDFTFDIKNKQGASTGENVYITYTFIRNSIKSTITESRKPGETVHYNIDEFLLEGTNTIIIGVTGQSSLAATTASITYQVVNLMLQDETNISKVYNLSDGSKIMEVFFSISGYGTKTVEWFLDGTQLDFVKSEDEVVDVSSDRTKYITLSNLSSGVHSLQIRAYTIINGERFYTDTLYREIIIHNNDTSDNVVAVATTIPQTHGIVTEENPLVFYNAEQYLPYTVRFATRQNGNVTIKFNDVELTTIKSTSGKENTYTIVSNKYGSLPISFVVGEVEREIPISVNKSTLDLEEITNLLEFDFTAKGRSNSETNKDVWSYEDYTAIFEGFNWNSSSGWVDNALLINSGASFAINYSPLQGSLTNTGKTLEIEFATRNVENDDAVICDLRNENGVGLVITASEARLISAAGVEVSSRFKAGEKNRITFVINRKNGVTYKCLAFVYINGIISGAVNYGVADNFSSDVQLKFVGSTDAQVELYTMRFYNTALSSDNILNNYILYRNTLEEMLSVYYRNDIYAEGTVTFSPDLMQHTLPVMIFTGDIPTLEAATTTKDQILVDIEYVNEQDPTKSFTMKDAALRIQGTSSLAYPRKNFRIYTDVEKSDSVKVYDYQGKEIVDKLYSFKDGAQPVNCWCLKADYAESSGTHNTAIARLWNDVMYNAVIKHVNVLGEEVNGNVLRTQAQIAARNANYEYDVRTTIDGFPIVLFYRLTPNDENLVFLGKYNFNNDKSTPSVFGFENIPNFDNSRMQCWETKDNGHPLGLFTDVSNFDSNWDEAFESRYPDTSNPNTADLKAFSIWVSNVSSENFITEKWAHLDVYKVAAYYCYLMRFGAVDQVVKNGFITSEDGEHFFYINYDNDTINGLINTGKLTLPPTINRQSIGSDGEYVYAGHSSKLWNLLEADQEFLDIVSIVDNALYTSGLSYDKVIKVFNDEQASKWVERVYNQDAEYKYLLPYVNTATNNLFMLQGSRSSHRSWWLSRRFSLYDSLFVSGAYRDSNISFKCLNDTQPNQRFTVTAGTAMNFGYGVNNGIRETGVALDVDESHTFVTVDTLNLGDVVKIFAAPSLLTLDFSEMANRLVVLDCSAASDNTGTKLKKLILGGDNVTNTELASISGINVLTSLQEVNIKGFQNISSLDLTKQADLRKLYASGSGLASVTFAAGAPIEVLDLSSAMLGLDLIDLPYLESNNLTVDGGNINSIPSINISGCPNISNDFTLAYNWIVANMQNYRTFVMDNVDWVVDDVTKLYVLTDFKAFEDNILTLNGKVTLPKLTEEQYDTLVEKFGEDAFSSKSDLQLCPPDELWFDEDVTINEGEEYQFSVKFVTTSENHNVTYSISEGSREGVVLDSATGLITSVENGLADTTLTITATFTGNDTISKSVSLFIKKRIYPSSETVYVNGADNLLKDETYTYGTTTEGINGDMITEWEFTGDIVTNGYAEIGSTTDTTCTIHRIKGSDTEITGTLTLTLKRRIDGYLLATKSKTITIPAYVYPSSDTTSISGPSTPSAEYTTYNLLVDTEGVTGSYTVEWLLDSSLEEYLEISESTQNSVVLHKKLEILEFLNGDVSAVLKKDSDSSELFTVKKSLTLISDKIAVSEVTNPTLMTILYEGGLSPRAEYLTKDEAAAITNIGEVFQNPSQEFSFDEFVYFTGLTAIPDYAFRYAEITSIILPETITSIGYQSFYNVLELQSITIPDSVISIGNSAFAMCVDMKNVTFGTGLKTIDTRAFENCSSLTSVTIPQNVEKINSSAFSGCEGLTYLNLNAKYVANYAFDVCTSLTSVYIGENVETPLNGRIVFNSCHKLLFTVSNENPIYSAEDGVLFRYHSDWGGRYLEAYCKDEIQPVYVMPDDCLGIDLNAFINCTFLTSITISQQAKEFGSNAFRACEKLENVIINNNNVLTAIHAACFQECKKLTSITIPESVTSIGQGAFQKCYLLKAITFPPGITTISPYTFYQCMSLTSFTIPDSVTSIGNYAFEGCSSLTSINIPESVTFIDAAAFNQCSSLTSVHISDIAAWCNIEFKNVYSSPLYFTKRLYLNNEELTELVIPNGVTTLKQFAFYMCESLNSITIPESVTNIYDYGFAGCVNVSKVTSFALKAPTVLGSTFGISTTDFIGINATNKTLVVPMNSTGYDKSWWLDPLQSANKCGFTLKYTYEPTECTSLYITADNVSARKTSTTIHWTAITNGTDIISGEYMEGIEVKGTATSDVFEQNTSTTETVERTISFTYLGVTATTTITQGVWVENWYDIDLNENWHASTTVPNPDSTIYDGVYESFSNYNVGSTAAIMYIDIEGYETFRLYIRSNGEPSYDYVMVSQLDQTITNNTSYSDSTLVKAHTRTLSNSGTAISDYMLVEFTNIDEDSHRITVLYRKDSGSNSGTDRGYVLIPKNQ